MKSLLTKRYLLISIAVLLFVGTGLTVFNKSSSPSSSPRAVIKDFMRARLNRDAAAARSFLSQEARDALEPDLNFRLIGTSNPHFGRYTVLETRHEEGAEPPVWVVWVKVTEEFTGIGPVGWFEEAITLVQTEAGYMIHAIERGPYHSLE